jgi:ABC-2 type transport system ATP-binding protein
MFSDSFHSGGILLSGVSKSYGDVRAVRSLDLLIAPGETVALLGPNAAGKTTTIDMILGLTRPDSGRVSLFGMSPAQAVADGAVGGMLQSGAPLEYLRVGELVRLMASYYPRALPVDEVLRLAGIADLADRWVTKLSAGQIQRVRFAAAVVGDPDLLVLDEPTVGIDVEGRREFWRAMRARAGRGKTVLFATHYLEEADAFADRIVLIAHGTVVADGATSEIKALAGRRTIRATLRDVDAAELSALPGVVRAERQGDTVTLLCSDVDSALRELLGAFAGVRDVEVLGSSLEEAFLELTSDSGRDHAGQPNPGNRQEALP